MGKRQVRNKIRELKKRIRQSQKTTKDEGTTKHCKNMQKRAAKLAGKLRNM